MAKKKKAKVSSGSGKNKRKRSPWPIALIFRLVLIIAASALVMSYISVYFNPRITSIPLFFGLYFIPLVLINVLLLIAGLLRRSGATWITFIVLLPSLLFADLFVGFSSSEASEKGIALKVCTYNVGMFSQQKSKTKVQELEGIARFVAKEEPGVVCMQEFFIRDTNLIAENFPEYQYRYYHFFRMKTGSRFGNIIMSKFPIVESGKLTFKGSTNLCVYVDIEHFGKKIRVYNTHLESHNMSFTSLIKRMSNSQQVSDELIEVHDKLASTFKKRALQVDSIARHAQASEVPSIICGDFNDTPMSYTYHKLVKNKKDSFKESGKGFSASYRFLWPVLRIDYILYPKEFGSMNHRTVKVPFSDHYPVFAEIIIP